MICLLIFNILVLYMSFSRLPVTYVIMCHGRDTRRKSTNKTCQKIGTGITSSSDINKYSIYLSPFITLSHTMSVIPCITKKYLRWHCDQGTSSKDNTKSGVDIGETSKHLVKSCCKAARDASEKDPASKLSQISTTSPWMNWGCLLFMGKGLLLLRMHAMT